MSSPIGKLLKQYRENCGLTQQQVAKALNVDRSTYTYYEIGTTTPSAPVIIKLSRIFQVPYTVFMNGFIQPENEVLSDNDVSAKYTMSSDYTDLRTKEKIYTLTNDERQLLVLYRILTREQKEELMDDAVKLNEQNPRK